MERLKQGVFAALMACMSFYLMKTASYGSWMAIIVTLIVGFTVAWFAYKHVRTYLLEFYRNHIGLAGIVLAWGLYTVYHMRKDNQTVAVSVTVLPTWIYGKIGYLAAGVGVGIVFMVVVRFIYELVTEIWAQLPQHIRKEYVIATVVYSAIVLVFFTTKMGWYTYFDAIYSADCSAVLGYFYGHPDLMDVRHPLFNMVSYPLNMLVLSVNRIFVPRAYDSMFNTIGLQMISIQLMLWSGLMIQRMTKHDFIFRLYCCCNAVMFYCLIVEKYQLSVFLLVLYVYLRSERKKGSDTALALTGGMMLTSYVIGIAELIAHIPLKEKAKNVGRVIGWTALLAISGGYFLFFQTGLSGILYYKDRYDLQVSVAGRIRSVLWMLQSCFVPLNSFTEKYYIFWNDVTTGWSLVGVLILLIALIGAVRKWKKYSYQIAAAWFVFAWILFVVLNWSVVESPLFNIYFFWSIIMLFVAGVDWIIGKLRMNPRVVYSSMCVIFGIAGAIEFIHIHMML